ncbi:MAG TPA: biotin--[acetyl-CoA-carboxylase] ligase [Caulobacteraceae bacterium]|nr:biotin--[acetyl-CoA-carboxylase] ligase [Caulobacteraceae bacterium]
MAHPPFEVFDDIDSTNAEARRRAERGDFGPVWITAARQSAGRGRRGRAWATPTGNLAATLLSSTSRSAADAARLSFVAALAVADLARAFLPERLVSLKWPNDLLIGGRKAAGILVESGQAGAGLLWVAVGIGVNLAVAPAVGEPPPTSFAEHLEGSPAAPLEALEVLADAFERWRGVWDSAGFEPIREAWMRRAHGIGGPCVVRLTDAEFRGVAEALEADGALRLRLDGGGVRRITAGDVFF